MAKSGPKKIKEVELEPDAWSRFERAVGVVELYGMPRYGCFDDM
jgi:hypothetical protein